MRRLWLTLLAIAGAAIAIFYLLTKTLPVDAVPVMFVVMGFVNAGQFVHHYVQNPPSLARLEKLKSSGQITVMVLAMGTGSLVSQFISRAISVPFYLVPIIYLSGGVIGYLAIGRWHTIAVRDFSRRQSEHFDFEEDAEGNPIRAVAPATADEEVIETWEDLIRAQRKRRGLPAPSEPPPR